jgi:hypothetical protein
MLLMPIEFPLSTEERAAYCEFIPLLTILRCAGHLMSHGR